MVNAGGSGALARDEIIRTKALSRRSTVSVNNITKNNPCSWQGGSNEAAKFHFFDDARSVEANGVSCASDDEADARRQKVPGAKLN